MALVKIGDKFGMLTVTNGPIPKPNNIKYWTCVCSCGTTKDVYQARLINNTTRSCGCTKVVTEETKALLKERRKGQPAPRPKGYQHSEEAKAKMKASQVARRERERAGEEPQVSSGSPASH